VLSRLADNGKNCHSQRSKTRSAKRRRSKAQTTQCRTGSAALYLACHSPTNPQLALQTLKIAEVERFWAASVGSLPTRNSIELQLALTLRVLGGVGLTSSLVLWLLADHTTMEPLVWVMAVADPTLTVALELAWRLHLLAQLVVWARACRAGA
jgi:hypothetical protein